jgi:transcriptional regulator with XRE-family HTH domain
MSNLKSIREEQGLSVEDLSQRANVTVETIDGIEAGTKPASFSTSLKLARALGVDVKSIQEFTPLFGSASGAGVEPLLGPKVGP